MKGKKQKQIKTHTFKLGKYYIEICDSIYGDTMLPDEIRNGEPINYVWADVKKIMSIVITGKPLVDFDTELHEALHAQGIPNEYIHDKDGNSTTITITKFLWRLGYRKVK